MLRIKVKKSLYVQVLCAALSDVLKFNVEGPDTSVLRGLHSSPQFLSARLQLVAFLEDQKPALSLAKVNFYTFEIQ